MGLRARRSDRDRDRLRDIRAERLADRFDQVQLRRLGISQFAGPLARRSGGACRPMAGKIQGLNLQSYLFFGSANRLYQHVKALLARHPECRLSGVRLQARHRHRFVGRVQLCADQAQPRSTSASGRCWCTCPPAAQKALRSSGLHFGRASRDRAGAGPRAGMVRERDHRAASGPRAGRRPILRDWFTQILGTERRRRRH